MPDPSSESVLPPTLYALVDCSAFYCSCERVFDPALLGVPVAVLSNNDGCIIARSQEVKDLGIPMGAPFFKHRRELRAAGVRVFSSNYTLYGDMSRRVMETLLTLTPDVHPYSIDEAFLGIPTCGRSTDEVRARALDLAREVRRRVLLWTGIPVRVSVARTKTLAKAASEYARAQMKQGGEPVVCFYGHPDREAWLAEMPVGDVWGIGRRWAAKLEARGARTARDLAALPDAVLLRELNVVGLRTAMELRGVSCVVLDDAPVRQTMIRSRSFGEPVSDLATLRRAVATHAARAGEKLRREGLVAGRIGAFVTTKGFGAGPHRSDGRDRTLTAQTNRTPDLIRAALLCLGSAFSGGGTQAYGYRKAGVVLSELRPEGSEQTTLFDDRGRAFGHLNECEARPGGDRQARLMASVDALNARFGGRTVVFGSMGPPSALRKTRDGSAGAPRWEMRREHMTARYTTRWNELAVANAR